MKKNKNKYKGKTINFTINQNTKLPFGKYKGRIAGEIAFKDWRYMRWLDTLPNVTLSRRLQDIYYDSQYSWIDDELDSEFRAIYDL